MSYDAQYERLESCAAFDLKGVPSALDAWCGPTLPAFPERPNTRTTRGTRCLAHIGPEHWLLWDVLSEETALISALRPHDSPAEISVVTVSDAYARFRVTGPDADDILAIACPMDLHRSVFAQAACSFTEIFSLKGLIWRCEEGFEFAVERSFGDMVSDYLNRALGIPVDPPG